jgi:hypothetical protein
MAYDLWQAKQHADEIEVQRFPTPASSAPA